jgi:hypothetical protein
MALTLDGTNGIVSSGSITTQSATGVIFSDSSSLPAASSPFSLKNRIINGDMVIDQRNAGASVTITSTANITYTLDRYYGYGSAASKFSIQQNAGSVTPPAGFTNYLGCTSLSAYSISSSDIFFVGQRIEGFNTADLGWGTASARTVTLSFWVRSSLTGTFGGVLTNSSRNRSYPFTYTISAANTWEQKTVTIAGDTTGTWLTTNGVGIELLFGLGVGSTGSGTAGAWAGSTFYSATGATSVVGTNGATLYITGVQLERNTTATPFEWLPYSTELALCQRYYYRIKASGTNYSMFGPSWNENTTRATGQIKFPVTMRIRPTALEQTGTAANYSILHGVTATVCSAVPAYEAYTNADVGVCFYIVSSGLTAGQGSALADSNGTAAYLGWSAEL